MNKRYWINLGISFAIGVVCDFIVAYILHRYLDDRAYGQDSTLVYFGLIFGTQVVAGIYVGIKNGVIYALMPHEPGAKLIAKMLADQGFPRPHTWHSASTYLADLTADEESPEAVRMKASFYQGEIAGFNTAPGFFASLTFARQWDEAIKLLAQDQK